MSFLKSLLYPPADLAERRVLGFDSSKNPTFLYKANLIGKLASANFNSTSDQIIKINSSNAVITHILVTNASQELDAADGGVYAAASKAGTAIVAATQVYTALVASTDYLHLTLNASFTSRVTAGQIYFSLTGAEGSAATADIYVFGHALD